MYGRVRTQQSAMKGSLSCHSLTSWRQLTEVLITPGETIVIIVLNKIAFFLIKIKY